MFQQNGLSNILDKMNNLSKFEYNTPIFSSERSNSKRHTLQDP